MTLKRMKEYFVLGLAITMFVCVMVISLLLTVLVNWWYIPYIQWKTRRSRANQQSLNDAGLASSPRSP